MFSQICVSSSDPKAETRLYVTVNGFEFHVYNRTDLYARLQETFGLEPTLITPKKDEDRAREDRKKTLERSDLCSQGKSSFTTSLCVSCNEFHIAEYLQSLAFAVVLIALYKTVCLMHKFRLKQNCKQAGISRFL